MVWLLTLAIIKPLTIPASMDERVFDSHVSKQKTREIKLTVKFVNRLSNVSW